MSKSLDSQSILDTQAVTGCHLQMNLVDICRAQASPSPTRFDQILLTAFTCKKVRNYNILASFIAVVKLLKNYREILRS